MSTLLTVILPTYNPRLDYLERVLNALKQQTLAADQWRFLLVDNNSKPALAGRVDLAWHPNAELVEVPTPGKMHALAEAFVRLSTDLLLILDDDTVPAEDLLQRVVDIAARHPHLGAWSTRVDLEFEDPSSPPPQRLRHLLAERDVTRVVWSNDPDHWPSTAWGCGMALRRQVAAAYLDQTQRQPGRLQLDPMGDQPGYGGDTDLSYTACSIGLGTGVFPELRIVHLIPKRRCTVEYLLRNLEAHEYSHYLQHWVRTGAAPSTGRLAGSARRLFKWITSDSLGRAVLAAEERGRAAARKRIATGRDDRPVTHR